jgi:hypothetical protein
MAGQGAGAMPLIGTLVALAPALIPLAGALAADTVGLTAMAGAATLGVGAFALLEAKALSTDKAFQAQLTPTLNLLTKAFDGLVKQNSAALLAPLQAGIQLLISILPLLTPIIQTVSSALMGLIKPLQEAVNSGALKNFIAQLLPLIGPAITDFARIAGNIVQGLGQILFAFAPFGGQLLDGWLKMTASFATIGSDPGFKAFVAWAIAQVPLVNAVLGDLVKVAGGLLVFLEPVGQLMLRLVDALLGGSTGLNTIGDAITHFLDSIPSGVKVVTDVLGHIADVVVPVLGQVIDSLLFGLSALLPKLGPALGKIVKALVFGLTDILQITLPTILPDLVHGLIGLLQLLLPAIPALLPALEEVLNALIDGLLTPISAKIMPNLIRAFLVAVVQSGPAWAVALGQLGGILTQALSYSVGQWGQFLAPILGGLGKNVGNWFSTDLPKFILDSLANIGTWLVGLGTHLIEGLVQGLIVAVFLVRDLLFTWPAQFGAWLATAVPAFGKAAGEWLVGLDKGIISGWNNQVVPWFQNLPRNIGNFLVSADKWLISSGTALLNGLGAGLVHGWAQISDFFMNLPRNIGNFLVGADRWLIDAGRQVVAGLQNGIGRAWDSFLGWIHRQIDLIPKAIRDALGIASPSKVTDQLGEYTGLGFGNGLVRSLNDAVDRAQATLRTRMGDLSAAATANLSAQVNASLDGSAAAAADGFQQLASILKALLDKTATADDIARANRILARTGTA